MKPEIETTAAGEEWRPVKGFEGSYEVSNLGRVRSLDRNYIDSLGRPSFKKGVIRKQRVNRCGYFYLGLCSADKKKTKCVMVHRLVALHFVPGYKEGLVVNHKDENKLNNRADNLEWCTSLYNNEYSDVNADKRLPVYQYDLEGNFIASHKGTHPIEKMFGARYGALWHVLYLWGTRFWKGYIWSYEKHSKIQIPQKRATKKKGGAVMQYTKDGKDIERFDNAKMAAEKMCVSVSTIYHSCNHNKTYAGYYKWRYVT